MTVQRVLYGGSSTYVGAYIVHGSSASSSIVYGGG